MKNSPEKSNLNLTKLIWTFPNSKMNWTRPKQFEPVQNHFRPIEGQGISSVSNAMKFQGAGLASLRTIKIQKKSHCFL